MSLKILFTICCFYTHENLSNRTTFRPVKSGATIPIKGQCHEMNNFFGGPNNQISTVLSTFCISANGFFIFFAS